MNEIKIGVTGYADQKFDASEAVKILRETYDLIDGRYPGKSKTIVSGLTNIGVPALAYREAVLRGWRTVGIACSKAKDYDCFPVDEEIIVGQEWGDESPTFIKSVDVFIRIGGGEQAIGETAEFRKSGRPVFEYDLST